MPNLSVAGQVYVVEAVLFDKDGTLLDFVHTWGRWGELLLACFSEGLLAKGLEPLEAGLLARWGIIRDEMGATAGYDRNSPISMGTLEELLTLLTWEGHRKGLSWAEAKLLAADCRMDADRRLDEERTVRLLPGAFDFVQSCREAGVKVGLVTADETSAAVKHLEWLGIRSSFSVCMGADQTARSKPHPDMVEEVCRRLGVSCEETLVIGDTNGDMMMAKAAGALAVGFDYVDLDLSSSAEDNRTEGFPAADRVIHAYSELSWTKG